VIAAVKRDDLRSRSPIVKAFPVGCQIVKIDKLWGDSYGQVTQHLTEGLIEITWENGNTGAFHWALIDELSIRRVKRRKKPIIEPDNSHSVVIETPPEPITPPPASDFPQSRFYDDGEFTVHLPNGWPVRVAIAKWTEGYSLGFYGAISPTGFYSDTCAEVEHSELETYATGKALDLFTHHMPRDVQGNLIFEGDRCEVLKGKSKGSVGIVFGSVFEGKMTFNEPKLGSFKPAVLLVIEQGETSRKVIGDRSTHAQTPPEPTPIFSPGDRVIPAESAHFRCAGKEWPLGWVEEVNTSNPDISYLVRFDHHDPQVFNWFSESRLKAAPRPMMRSEQPLFNVGDRVYPLCDDTFRCGGQIWPFGNVVEIEQGDRLGYWVEFEPGLRQWYALFQLRTEVRVRVDVPPDPIVEAGDRVTFPIECFGEMRVASGIVTKAEKGIALIQYQVLPPPKNSIEPVYYRNYPDSGVLESEVQIPKERIYVDATLHPINAGDWVSCRRQVKGQVIAFHPDRKTCVEVLFDGETTYWKPSSLTCVEKNLSKDFLPVKRKFLVDRLSEVRLSGDVAPPNCWIESSSTSKQLASGEKRHYTYWRVKAAKPIFQGEGGKMTSIIHLGDDATPKYKDWCDRMERRRKLNDVEHQLDQVERELQRIRG